MAGVVQVIVAIGKIALWTGGPTIGSLVATAALSAGINYLLREKPPTPTYDFASRKVSAKRINPPRREIFGRCKVGVSWISTEPQGGHHSLIGAICDHSLKKIHGIEFNSQPYLSPDELQLLQSKGYVGLGNTYVENAALRNEVNGRRYNLSSEWINQVPTTGSIIQRIRWSIGDHTFIGVGLDGKKAFYENAETWWKEGQQGFRRLGFERGWQNLNWFANDAHIPGFQARNDDSFKLTGISYIYLGLMRTPVQQIRHQGKESIYDAVPNVTLDVERGNNDLVRPRTDPSNPSTQIDGEEYLPGNAALCLFHLLASHTPYGRPLFEIERLNHAAAIRAAQVCEEKKLTANGMFERTDNPAGLIDELLAAMNAGASTERNGLREIFAGITSTPTQTITDADVEANSISLAVGGPISDRVSAVEISYQDKDGNVQSVAVKRDPAQPFTSVRQTTAAFIQTEAQAMNYARILLKRIWDSDALAFNLADLDKAPATWDRINVNFASVGASGTYRVLEVVKGGEGIARVECIREADDLYGDEISTPYKPAPPPTPPAPPEQVADGLVIGAAGQGWRINEARDELVI